MRGGKRPGAGAPKKETGSKSKSVLLKLTEEDLQHLDFLAARSGKSRTAYLTLQINIRWKLLHSAPWQDPAQGEPLGEPSAPSYSYSAPNFSN
jgi:hypothetical protein